MNKRMRSNLLLLLVAFIWGSAFVAQSSAMDYVGPYTYNMTRNVLAFAFLVPVIWFMEGKGKSKSVSATLRPNKQTVIGGICCGIVLAVASTFQQVGITMTTAGKAGFITALYIIMVPILGVFIGKKIPKIIWLCVALAIVGFFLLCVKDGFSVSKGDVLVLICALCYSVHIMVIDHFTSKNVDGVKMSCIQFLVAAIVLSPLMIVIEHPSMDIILSAWVTIGYAGILSSGVGYTLQIVAQKDTDPTTATLIMSLESVFAALSGWLILKEVLLPKEILGCVLVFVAVILAQIPLPTRTKDK
jgi:drug/metabolite transporter (DMT)-like permease